MENPSSTEVLMGKSSINGPFSIAMLNSQRVYPLYTICYVVLPTINRPFRDGLTTKPMVMGFGFYHNFMIRYMMGIIWYNLMAEIGQ